MSTIAAAARCPVRGCEERRSEPWHLVCGKHWIAIPEDLRNEVWDTYRRACGSEQHLAACRAALRHVIEAEFRARASERRGRELGVPA